MLASEQYRAMVDLMPILCVDLVLTNAEGEYLLVKRNNAPLQGLWWVPGGRILKGERLEVAAARKLREELGLTMPLQGPVGFCEYLCKENPFGLASGHHAVAFIFTGIVSSASIQLDAQSRAWGYFPNLPTGFNVKGFVQD